MRKVALISGISGQDGSYLADLLVDKGYEVHGMVRRVALEDPKHRLWRLSNVLDKIHLHACSLENYASLYRVMARINPSECYHLAAQSYVSYSFEDEFSTLTTNIEGTVYMLSAFRENCPGGRFYFAGSSEMFGKVRATPQNEETPFHPRSPYGISKVAGFDLTRNYREAYGLFACSGILFNHESPRRGYEFVTRKITQGVAAIKLGQQEKLSLGNLDALRDWGYAGDYVDAMWRMLQQDEPDDYVVATGISHSVRELCERAFAVVDLDWSKYVEVNETFFRPAEVQTLMGDATKARSVLKWEPRVAFDELVEMMVRSDLERLK